MCLTMENLNLHTLPAPLKPTSAGAGDEAVGCRIYFVFWPTSHLTVITCAIIHHEMNVVLYQDFIKCGLWISGLLKSGRVWDMTVCIKENKTKLGFPGDLILTGGQE